MIIDNPTGSLTDHYSLIGLAGKSLMNGSGSIRGGGQTPLRFCPNMKGADPFMGWSNASLILNARSGEGPVGTAFYFTEYR